MEKSLTYESIEIIIAININFLKRFPQAASELMTDQLTKIGRLLNRVKRIPNNSLIVQAKAFFKFLFNSFGESGLFMHLFNVRGEKIIH